MNLKVTLPPRTAAGSPVTPVLRAVLLADLADSTAFVQRFGDARAAVAFQRLDLKIRDLLEFTGGRLIDKADGLLAIFERPIQAVDFALRYQQALRQFSIDEGAPLAARVGIHVGELMTWANTDADVRAGAKPLEVEGLAKPVAARLMALALPGQVLVSSMAQALAQRAQAELGERADRVKWVSHGRYRFKGVPAPVLVHEVGEVGTSPLRQPPSGHKVWRELPLWRRPPVLAAELAVMIAVVGFFAWSALRSPPALAFQQRDWVVVGDLSNFTGDTRLDDSLQTALRISLEQSRFVNVVPDLKVRSVLQRMGRRTDASVDRSVGSEIALREGARALLLPSVAEVGGKLRISLEVVDPTNQATVYADSEEGRGVESALASLDAVNGRLRERLGESIDQVHASGMPLAQITTPSIDALRLYTLANEAAIRDYKFDESLRLLDLAIATDPSFAMAYSARARLRLADSDYVRAKQDFAQAQKFRNRLSEREALTLDEGLAEFGTVKSRIDSLGVITRMYPDTYRAYFQLAYNRAFYQQQYQQAMQDLKPAMTPKYQRYSGVLHLDGLLNLGLERFPEANLDFERAEGMGSHDPLRYHGDSFAAQRQFDRAAQIVATQAKTGFAGADLDARLPEITYPLDRGEWSKAVAAAKALSLDPGDAPMQKRTYFGTWLGLRTYAEGAGTLPEWRQYIAGEMKRAIVKDDPDVVGSTFASLYGATMTARLGDTETTKRVLAQLRGSVAPLGYPALDDMLAIADAEVALQDKQAPRAIALLQARLSGGELNWVHVTLLRAYRQQGALAEAGREAAWLATHRGRAYVEWNSQYLLQPLNVLESDLALLDAAEIGRQSNDAEEARRELQRLDRAWANPPPFVAERLKSIRDWISQRTYRTGQKSRP
jgi:putative peptide modification system cyclase